MSFLPSNLMGGGINSNVEARIMGNLIDMKFDLTESI